MPTDDVKTGEVLPAVKQNPKDVVQRFRQSLEIEASLDSRGEGGSRDIVERIQANILTAETDEAIFGAADAGLPGAEDFQDVPIVIVGYTANRSAFEGTGFYAVVSAYNLEEESEFQFSIGAESAIAQLKAFSDRQLFEDRTFKRNGNVLKGLPCAIRGKKTQAGYTALFFQPLTQSEKKRTGVEWPI